MLYVRAGTRALGFQANYRRIPGVLTPVECTRAISDRSVTSLIRVALTTGRSKMINETPRRVRAIDGFLKGVRTERNPSKDVRGPFHAFASAAPCLRFVRSAIINVANKSRKIHLSRVRRSR